MIAFGCAVTDVARYRRYAEPGIRRAAQPDSEIFIQAAPGANFRTHNLLLERAAEANGLEALVLVDERAEIIDPQLADKVRAALRDTGVAVAGCIGATDVRSIAWWEGAVSGGSSVHRHAELVGEEFDPLAWDGWNGNGTYRPAGEVDAVDGVLMALSPWAVQNVRFDESLGPKYGHDVDFCLQVRAAGRKVVTGDLRVAHHYPLGVVEDPETWMEAHMRAAEKWDGRLPGSVAGSETDWRARARRAEGEAAAARLLSATRTYQIQALMRQQGRELEHATSSLSWRATKPLRQLSLAVARARERSG